VHRADHVLLGTGFRIDVSQLELLSPELVAGLSLVDGYPVLDKGFQSSVPGLHFVGAPAAWSFGPLMRFVAGTGFTARVLARRCRPVRLAGGALVVGADYRALGAVRSLGRRGIRVWVLRKGDDRLAGLSRYASGRCRSMTGPTTCSTSPHATASTAGRWFPSGDETAALVARNHEALGERYRLTTPPWAVTQYAYDKRLTYPLADGLGIDVPRNWYPADRDEVAALACEFPVILKPAVREGF